MTPRRRPTVVVLVGPDGSGKTTAADAVTSRMEARAIQVTRVHHRPRILGPKAVGTEVVTDPHGQRPRNIVSGLPKLLLVFVDYTLAHRWAWRRLQGLLLIERGWYDMLVDPRRYRLTPGLGRLAGLMGRLLPRPDLLIVLTGSAEMIHARKPETTVEEVNRQNRRWQQLLPEVGTRSVLVDTTEDGNTSVERVVREVEKAMAGPGQVGAWRRVPLTPPRLTMSHWGDAKGALGVYQPLRPFAKLSRPMRAGLVQAGLGRRVWPAFDPSNLFRSLELPTDGLVCVEGHRPGRMVVGVAHRGRLSYVAKIGMLEDASLRSEAATLQMLSGAHPPFVFPRLHWCGEWEDRFALVCAAVGTSQLRPLTAEDVVDACSALVTGIGGGPAMTHGDLAPWNLTLSDQGLVILDWESARQQYFPLYDLTFFVVRRGSTLGAYGPAEARGLLIGTGSPGRRHLDQIGLEADMATEMAVRCLDEMPTVAGEERFVSELRGLLSQATRG